MSSVYDRVSIDGCRSVATVARLATLAKAVIKGRSLSKLSRSLACSVIKKVTELETVLTSDLRRRSEHR